MRNGRSGELMKNGFPSATGRDHKLRNFPFPEIEAPNYRLTTLTDAPARDFLVFPSLLAFSIVYRSPAASELKL